MLNLIRLARPSHWIKNFVVFLPVIFGMRIGDVSAWSRVVPAALAFCFASAFAYIVNDIKDIERDRAHPWKKNRPLAVGRMTVKTAIAEAAVLLLFAVVISGLLSLQMLFVTILYIVLQLAYSFILKQKVLIDVICIAIGFVLRAVAGAVAIGVEISPWLFICMFTMCLFMGFCKRCNESVTIGDLDQAHNHRLTLIEYTPQLLTHLITLSAGIAVVSFLFYSLSASTIEKFGTDYFIYTLPVIVYAVFRFAMLSMKGVYAGPMELILKDSPFQATMVLWVLSACVIIYHGRAISEWLSNPN